MTSDFINKTIYVTGASGYIAAHVVEQLLMKGYTVKGSVRDIKNKDKTAHLTNLPGAKERLILVEADLLIEGSFDESMKGCDILIHTASPYKMNVKDPQKDLVDPAVIGTENALKAASKSDSIRRVILTSSVAAIADHPQNKLLTEKDWNDTSSLTRNPYYYSKTLAEKKAWDFWDQEKKKDGGCKWDLIVINPVMVIGPSHTNNVNTSVELIRDIATNAVPAIVGLSFGIVDVRDVAKAHILAMENPNASGRYIACNEVLTMDQITKSIKASYPQLCVPCLQIPDILIRSFSYFMGSQGSFLRTQIGYGVYQIDNNKIKHELGMTFMDSNESLKDTVADLHKWGHVKKI